MTGRARGRAGTRGGGSGAWGTNSNGNQNGDRRPGSGASGGNGNHPSGPNGAASTAGAGIVATSPASNLPTKSGKSGTPIKLMTNYFAMLTKPDFKVIKYHVDFEPNEDRLFVKRALFNRVKNELPKCIFTGSSVITQEEAYPHQLENSKVLYSQDTQSNETIKITIRNPIEVAKTDFEYLWFANSAIRAALRSMQLTEINRDHYDTRAAKHVQAWQLEILPGYKLSVGQHEYQILANAEVLTKVVRVDTVLAAISRMLNQQKSRNEITRAIIGSVVMTKYNYKTYRVDDIDWNSKPADSFSRRDGTSINYAQYYKEKYNVNIRDMSQPMLLSMPKDRDRRGGNDEPIRLPPEVCNFTGLSEEQRNNFKLKQDLASDLMKDPNQRVQALRDLSSRMRNTVECVQAMRNWDMDLDQELVTVQGRQLQPVPIIYNDRQRGKEYSPDNADWTSFLRNSCFRPIPIMCLYIVCPQRNEHNIKALVREMQNLGIVPFGEPRYGFVPSPQIHQYLQCLKKGIDMKPKMICVVIPDANNKALYSAIKKFLCIDHPIPSQVLTWQKVLRDERRYRTMATKLVLQMTTKLGGEPWAVQNPTASQGTMIVGFDTYHDTVSRNDSFGALVASYNDQWTKYYSEVSKHPKGAELSSEISILFGKALRNYYQKNNKLPARVIFYRDGVGEGQIPQVKDLEIAAIQAQLKQVSPKPKLTFIVVSKRINTKFFAPRGRPNGGFTNPLPGTVVDNTVTLPHRYDFFIISQSVRQGTVNPTSYNVLLDESNLGPDALQVTTYKLCHLYFNWTGTIRVPAPCQYAHKLAYLAGESLHDSPVHEGLKQLLYFL